MIRSNLAFLIISAFSIGPAFAQTKTFDLINETGMGIVSFEVSPGKTNDWTTFVFDEGALPTNDLAQVNITDTTGHCAYDIKVEFQDGSVYRDTENLCDIESYSLSGE